jgi:hypothetical protein
MRVIAAPKTFGGAPPQRQGSFYKRIRVRSSRAIGLNLTIVSDFETGYPFFTPVNTRFFEFRGIEYVTDFSTQRVGGKGFGHEMRPGVEHTVMRDSNHPYTPKHRAP